MTFPFRGISVFTHSTPGGGGDGGDDNSACNGLSGYPRHYSDVIMGAMASQIISLTIVYSSVYSCADQRKYQKSASLAFVGGIHRWPVNSPHKGPVTRKMVALDDVIMVAVFYAHRSDKPTRKFVHIKSPDIITLTSTTIWSNCLGMGSQLNNYIPHDRHHYANQAKLWNRTHKNKLHGAFN